MSFSENLKHWRQVRGYTQPELAERASIEQSYLSKLENNRSKASDAVINRLSMALEIDTDTLLKDPSRNGHLKRHALRATAVAILFGAGFMTGYLASDYEVRRIIHAPQERLDTIWSLAPEGIEVISMIETPGNNRILEGHYRDVAAVSVYASRLLATQLLGQELTALQLDPDNNTFRMSFTGNITTLANKNAMDDPESSHSDSESSRN